MKARFGTKLCIVIIALFLLIFGAATLYVGIRLNAVTLNTASQDIVDDVIKVEKAVFNAEGYWTLRRIILLAIGAIEIISAFFLLTVPGKLRYKKSEFIVQQTENGEIRIAVRAIENLVRKCTDMHEEIEVSSLRISNHRDGVAVDLKASMPNNITDKCKTVMAIQIYGVAPVRNMPLCAAISLGIISITHRRIMDGAKSILAKTATHIWDICTPAESYV